MLSGFELYPRWVPLTMQLSEDNSKTNYGITLENSTQAPMTSDFNANRFSVAFSWLRKDCLLMVFLIPSRINNE